jgi:hypothetical protein
VKKKNLGNLILKPEETQLGVVNYAQEVVKNAYQKKSV